MFTSLLVGSALAIGQPPTPPPVVGMPPTYQVPVAYPGSTYPGIPVGMPPTYQVPTAYPGTTYPAIPGSFPTSNTGLGNLNTGVPQASPKTGENPMGQNGNGNGNGKEKEKEAEKPPEKNWLGDRLKLEDDKSTFMRRFYSAYYNQFFPPKNPPPEEPEPPRRAPPSPWSSPPFPGNEYQGYPLLGVPASTSVYPFMEALYGGPYGQQMKDSKIVFSGWVTAEGNWSGAKNSNAPTSYWITPNQVGLDQLVFKLERIADSVQTDHWDWGFRSIGLYGMDYRYTTAGGWGSEQLLKHNLLDGWDPVEQYVNVYVPGFLGGTDVRVGRWIACPDIETQYSVDNYMGSHSILFTYDTYTQTGIMVSQKINSQWMVQGVIHAGTDMAPWYPGAVPTFAGGVRWVSQDNHDAVYAWANAINSAQFRHFDQYGQPLGHDNFNYVVSTWEHMFNESIHTKTEAYYMWQYNGELGGTPSAGPVMPFGGGGGNGKLLPGLSNTYGILNYTMFGMGPRDYFTIRNEYFRDERGERTGTPGTYTSNSIGFSHQFNDVMMIRPEIGFYRNWTNNSFDNGTQRNLLLYGFDFTYRF